MTTPKDVPDFLEFLNDYIGQTDLISGYCYFHASFILRNLVTSCHLTNNIAKKSDELKDVFYAKDIQESVLFTGSAAEGLTIPTFHHTRGTYKDKVPLETFMADLDVMHIIDSINIHDGSTSSSGDFMLEPDDCHPGYTRLKVLSNSAMPKRLCTAIYNEAEYLDSSKFIMQRHPLQGEHHPPSRMSRENVVFVHGPAICMEATFTTPSENFKKTFSFDNVAAIHCPTWPSLAKKWMDRLHIAGWPAESVMQNIASAGCHFVPVAHSSSNMPTIEWRFSFSLAELVLARSLSITQRKTYMLLKLLCQDALVPKKVISSYYLKTLLFWACEEYPQAFWRELNIFCILLTLLDRLIYNIGQGCHPNYFMPENNLISHIPQHILRDILRSLIKIRKDPLSILFSFNDRNRLDLSRFPWRMAFKEVIQDMSDQLNGQQELMRTLRACAYCLHKMGFFNILDENYKVAENAFLQMASIMELHTANKGDHIGFVSRQALCIPDVLPIDTLVTYAQCLVVFYGWLFRCYPDKEYEPLLTRDCGRLHLCLASMQRIYPCSEDIKKKDNLVSKPKGLSQPQRDREGEIELYEQDQKEVTLVNQEVILKMLNGNPVDVADDMLTTAMGGACEEDHSPVLCDLAMLHFLLGNHERAHAYALQIIDRENALDIASWSMYGKLECCLFEEFAARTLPPSFCAGPSTRTIETLINSEGWVVVPTIMMACLIMVCLEVHKSTGDKVKVYIEMMHELVRDVPSPACLILLSHATGCCKL